MTGFKPQQKLQRMAAAARGMLQICGIAVAGTIVIVLDHTFHTMNFTAMWLLCRSMNPTVARAVHSLLYAVNLACSYLLMLAVMTFNIGYFFVVVAGLAIGNFLFGGSKSSDVCHAQS